MSQRDQSPHPRSGDRSPRTGQNPGQPDVAEIVRQTMATMMPGVVSQVMETMQQAFRDPEFRTGMRDVFWSAGSGSSSGEAYVWLERFNKQKPFAFASAKEPVEADNWIRHIEKILDVMGCPDQFRVGLATYKFENDAQDWWDSCVQSNPSVKDLSWAQFKEFFRDQYFTKADRDAYVREYATIRQHENETVSEYLTRFLRAVSYAGTTAGTMAHQTDKFLWSLDNKYPEKLVNIRFENVTQVADAARNLDRAYARRQAQKSSSESQRGSGSNQSSVGSASICDQCRRTHRPGKCMKALGACYNCRELGHIAKDCQKPQMYRSRDKGKQSTSRGSRMQ